MRPKVALNGRFSRAHHPTGTQIASFHLFDAILRKPREVDLVVFADPEYPGVREWASLPGTQLVPTPFRKWSRARGQIWEQLFFNDAALRLGCRVGHHPMNTSPANPGEVKSIVTLHDLNFLIHPEWYRLLFRLAYQWVALPGLHRASRVVVISHYIRDQVKQHLNISGPRLKVIPDGLPPLPLAPPIHESSPYIFCVGSYQPHKNLARLIQAYQKLRVENPFLKLKIAGLPERRFQQDRELDPLLKMPGVVRLGYLTPEELSATYRGASVFCYPSLEEGFGLPILEAMSVGVIVVTSNTSCMPETAGDAAIYVNPYDVDDMALGLRTALHLEPRAKEKLMQKGKDRTSLFCWGVVALQYLDLYQEVWSE
jgi:glycosyltransferase involved in cell wall biosynthesis